MKNAKKKAPVAIKKTRFEELTEDQPEIPEYTCDAIDEAKTILSEQMEALRSGNANLRTGVEYWSQICQDLLDEIAELKKEVNSLRRGIATKRTK